MSTKLTIIITLLLPPPWLMVQSTAISLTVCLSICISQQPHVQISWNYLYLWRPPLTIVQYAMYFHSSFVNYQPTCHPSIMAANAIVHCTCCVDITHSLSYPRWTSAFADTRGEKLASMPKPQICQYALFGSVIHYGSKLCTGVTSAVYDCIG